MHFSAPESPEDFDSLDAEYSSEPLSKTQLKKSMQDLQDLGKALIELPQQRLDALDLPESLREALHELRRVRSHEGRRRQLQYVGKLMRKVDPEPLREAVAAQRMPSARETLALHQAELWRDRLIADDKVLTDWMAQFPDTDAQQLRSLIRSARKEAMAAASDPAAHGLTGEPRKGRAYRDLFRIVRSALESSS
jgi:ribosome-associated protein